MTDTDYEELFKTWAAFDKALELGVINISMDGFDPETPLATLIEYDVDEITLTNSGMGRFNDIKLTADTTMGDAVKAIDAQMVSNRYGGMAFLEQFTIESYDTPTQALTLSVFIGS